MGLDGAWRFDCQAVTVGAMNRGEAIVAGQKIADWNVRHGSITARVTDASGRLVDGISAVQAASTDSNLNALRDAGLGLLEVANEALAGAWTGADGFDSPRKDALRLYAKAGSILGVAALVTGDEPELLEAAGCLFEGNRLTAQAKEYMVEIMRLVQT